MNTDRENAERTSEIFRDNHDGTGIVKLAAVVGCTKQRHHLRTTNTFTLLNCC